MGSHGSKNRRLEKMGRTLGWTHLHTLGSQKMRKSWKRLERPRQTFRDIFAMQQIYPATQNSGGRFLFMKPDAVTNSYKNTPKLVFWHQLKMGFKSKNKLPPDHSGAVESTGTTEKGRRAARGEVLTSRTAPQKDIGIYFGDVNCSLDHFCWCLDRYRPQTWLDHSFGSLFFLGQYRLDDCWRWSWCSGWNRLISRRWSCRGVHKEPDRLDQRSHVARWKFLVRNSFRIGLVGSNIVTWDA